MIEPELDGDAEIDHESFCQLLWAANGGQVNQKGIPIPGRGFIRGYCRRSKDCALCPIMAQELVQHPAEAQAWLCTDCVNTVSVRAKERRMKGVLLGHYTEGYCQNPACWMISRIGEPRYSVLLQLVLGPIRELLGDEG